MLRRIIEFIKLWPEVYSIPVAAILWVVCPYVLRAVDPTAAVLDAGVLQVFVLAAIGILVFNGLVFLGIKSNFPIVFHFYKSWSTHFIDLTKWQKTVVLLCLYLGLLLAFVLLAASLL